MFSLICVWINDWVNNREAGDLRRHRGHYDVNVMTIEAMAWMNNTPEQATGCNYLSMSYPEINYSSTRGSSILPSVMLLDMIMNII